MTSEFSSGSKPGHEGHEIKVMIRGNNISISVQSLIERCLMLHMDRDQCIGALAVHAQIQPLITLTVWRGLLKENKDFFQSYFDAISPRPFIYEWPYPQGTYVFKPGTMEVNHIEGTRRV